MTEKTPDAQAAQMPDAQAVEKRLKSIVEYVHDCERRVIKGEIMDLQGLDQNVMVVCEEIAALPREQGRALESKMSQLISGLDALAVSIKKQHEGYAALKKG